MRSAICPTGNQRRTDVDDGVLMGLANIEDERLVTSVHALALVPQQKAAECLRSQAHLAGSHHAN